MKKLLKYIIGTTARIIEVIMFCVIAVEVMIVVMLQPIQWLFTGSWILDRNIEFIEDASVKYLEYKDKIMDKL